MSTAEHHHHLAQVERAAHTAADAAEARDRAIKAAATAGVPHTAIANACGISRQRIGQIVAAP